MVQGYRQGSRAWVWGSSGLCPLPKQWLTPLRPDDEGHGPCVRTAMRATWCMGSYKWRWRNANRCVECVGSMPRCMHACTTDGMRLPSVVHTYRCGHTCMRPWTGSRCSSRTAQSAVEEWHVPGILLRRAAAAPASLARVRRSRRAFAHHQMQVSAGRETPVLLKGRQSGGGLLRRVLGALQMTASPAQVPPSVVAVNDTCGTKGRGHAWVTGAETGGKGCSYVAVCIQTSVDVEPAAGVHAVRTYRAPMLCSLLSIVGASSHHQECALLPTCRMVSATLPGAMSRRHWGITLKLPPPISAALGTQVQLSLRVGLQRHFQPAEALSSTMLVMLITAPGRLSVTLVARRTWRPVRACCAVDGAMVSKPDRQVR